MNTPIDHIERAIEIIRNAINEHKVKELQKATLSESEYRKSIEIARKAASTTDMTIKSRLQIGSEPIISIFMSRSCSNRKCTTVNTMTIDEFLDETKHHFGNDYSFTDIDEDGDEFENCAGWGQEYVDYLELFKSKIQDRIDAMNKEIDLQAKLECSPQHNTP